MTSNSGVRVVLLADLSDKKVGLQYEFQRVAAEGGVFIICSFKHSYTPVNDSSFKCTLRGRIKCRIRIVFVSTSILRVLNFHSVSDTLNFHHFFGSIV